MCAFRSSSACRALFAGSLQRIAHFVPDEKEPHTTLYAQKAGDDVPRELTSPFFACASFWPVPSHSRAFALLGGTSDLSFPACLCLPTSCSHYFCAPLALSLWVKIKANLKNKNLFLFHTLFPFSCQLAKNIFPSLPTRSHDIHDSPHHQRHAKVSYPSPPVCFTGLLLHTAARLLFFLPLGALIVLSHVTPLSRCPISLPARVFWAVFGRVARSLLSRVTIPCAQQKQPVHMVRRHHELQKRRGQKAVKIHAEVEREKAR